MIQTNGKTETAISGASTQDQTTHPFVPQMELGFGSFACQTPAARRRRLNRANWWFQRMRQLVDRACDWQPAPEPRPEQIWFPNTHRESAIAPQLNPTFSQICE